MLWWRPARDVRIEEMYSTCVFQFSECSNWKSRFLELLAFAGGSCWGLAVFFWFLVQAVRQFSIAILSGSEADALEASPSRHRRPRIFDDIFVGVFFSDFWYTQNYLMVLMGWIFGEFKNESIRDTSHFFLENSLTTWLVLVELFAPALYLSVERFEFQEADWWQQRQRGRNPRSAEILGCWDGGMAPWKFSRDMPGYAESETPKLPSRSWPFTKEPEVKASFLLRWSQFCTKCCRWPDAVVWPSAALCGKLSSKTLGCFNIPSHPIPSHGGLLENAEAHVDNVELCLWYILLKTDATNATMSCGNASSHFLMVGTGFLIVHGVVWLRQTQRMMTMMMRKTRSQCSCCLRRLALLGLPRGSPGVQRKQGIRMIWR